MRLRTIGLIVSLTLGLLAGLLPAEAQSSGKMRKIGYVSHRARPSGGDEAFRQTLRDLGWVEGKNIAIGNHTSGQVYVCQLVFFGLWSPRWSAGSSEQDLKYSGQRTILKSGGSFVTVSRPLRIEFPGAWYHVMNRGTNRQAIFHDPTDYQAFLTLAGETARMWDLGIHAYALMTNHYSQHGMRTGGGKVSTIPRLQNQTGQTRQTFPSTPNCRLKT
jgi:hypothetical protein